MALQIEPCPFCGGHHLHMVVHSLTYSVTCQSCRCRGPQKQNQELAVMQWNQTSRQKTATTSQLHTKELKKLPKPDDPLRHSKLLGGSSIKR